MGIIILVIQAILVVVGIFVNTHPEKTGKYRNPILLGCLILSAVGTALTVVQSRSDERAATTDKSALDQKLLDDKELLVGVKRQLVSQTLTLDDLELQGLQSDAAMTKLAESVHLPSNTPVSQLVAEVVAKLPKQSISVKGRNNVTSINQSGGQTASSIINQAKPPEYKVIQNGPFEVDPAGGYILNVIFEVVAETVPMNVVVAMRGTEITSYKVVALDSMVVTDHSGSADGWLWDKIDAPYGKYRIEIKTTRSDISPDVNISFNAK